MAKLEAKVFLNADDILGQYTLADLIDAIAELERCRNALHAQEAHPDYEYARSQDNRDRGSDWQRNEYVGPNGFRAGRWYWYRRKTDG